MTGQLSDADFLAMNKQCSDDAADADGMLSAAESLFAMKFAENIDNITGKNFVCDGIGKDGILKIAGENTETEE